jgi:hypothetical protein
VHLSFFTLILLNFAGHCFKLYSAYVRTLRVDNSAGARTYSPLRYPLTLLARERILNGLGWDGMELDGLGWEGKREGKGIGVQGPGAVGI